jgi:hypothetical protein
MANLTWFNIAICLVVSWGGYSYGYGFAIFVTSLGQPSFYEYFDLDREFCSTLHADSRVLTALQQRATTLLSKSHALFHALAQSKSLILLQHPRSDQCTLQFWVGRRCSGTGLAG